VNRLAILAILAISACSAPPKKPPRKSPQPPQAPRVFAGGHTQAYAAIFISPEVRMGVPIDLDVEPGRGMRARLEILSGPVEWLCDGTRAWTVYPRGCSFESSCDQAVRQWFDIGWGYAELARFIAGELPDTPGWTVRHRGLRRHPMPTKSVIEAQHRPFPGAVVDWGTWEPTHFDLAAAIANAKATACVAPAPPPPPPTTTP
jgi:hypothetical protein